MSRWRAYAVLLRSGNLPTVWTNVLAGALLAGAPVAVGSWLLVALALSLSYLGGMALNDYFDRDWDGRYRPERPIPSGAVPARLAAALGGVLLLAGLGLLLLAPDQQGLVPGLALLAAILLYDRFHKNNPLAPALMGACRGLSYLTAGLALAGQPTRALWLGALLQFGYILLLSVVAREQVRARRRGGGRYIPSVPWLLAGISLLDGLVAAAVLEALWPVGVGLAGALLTRLAQRWAPGD